MVSVLLIYDEKMWFYSKRIFLQGLMSSEYLLSVSGSGDGEDVALVLCLCGDKSEYDSYSKLRSQHLVFVVTLASEKKDFFRNQIFLDPGAHSSHAATWHLKVSMPSAILKLLLNGA